MSKVTEIDLEKLPEAFRLQRLVFRAAQKAFDSVGTRFTGRRELADVPAPCGWSSSCSRRTGS